jgi:transposase
MKGYKHLTADQEQQAIHLYAKTLSTREVADALSLTTAQVRRCLQQNGIRTSRAHGGACYQRIEEIRQWAAEGLTFSEIGRRVGVKHQAVAKFLRQHEIPYQPFDRSAPENNPFWRGGRVIDKDGYVLLKAPEHPNCDRHGYMREHRLVMERVLGRYLLATEVVHHLDGNRGNNAPENLGVFAANGQHLAETLTGTTKNLSPEGRERLREVGRQRQRARRNAIPLE